MEGTEPQSPTAAAEAPGAQEESSWTFSVLSQEEFEGLKEDPLELLRAVEQQLLEHRSSSSALRALLPPPRTASFPSHSTDVTFASSETQLEQNERFLDEAVQEQEKLIAEKTQLLDTVQKMSTSPSSAAPYPQQPEQPISCCHIPLSPLFVLPTPPSSSRYR